MKLQIEKENSHGATSSTDESRDGAMYSKRRANGGKPLKIGGVSCPMAESRIVLHRQNRRGQAQTVIWMTVMMTGVA
jgi:hypothetical protein